MSKMYFTSESVTEGHPDKICDQISDAILDEIIKNDKEARVACETVCTTGLVMIMGEISTTSYVDISKIARNVILDIGYNRAKFGFDGNTCSVITSIDEQSSDIKRGVDKNLTDNFEIGAGDQGIMFGFACDETETLMPMPINLAHALAKRLAFVRKNNVLDYLRPDGKTQVTIEYENGIPKRVDTIVISTQHNEAVTLEDIKKDIVNSVILPTVPGNLLDDKVKIFINPTGRFVIGGPAGDSGLTGRKIIVDTYGGYSRHGGGAFSGKDPTKVDRSASYAARYIAKNIVAAKIAKKCEVQLAYAIGVSQPVGIMIDTFNTGTYSDSLIREAVIKSFDFSPHATIKNLNLLSPIYRNLASYGHVGREDIDVAWEKVDLVPYILDNIKKLS